MSKGAQTKHAASLRVTWTLIIYLLASLLFSSWLVARCWPGNPFNRPLYQEEFRRIAALQVTAASSRAIDRAIVLLGRLPDNGDTPKLSHADIQELLGAISFARAILTTPAASQDCPSERSDALASIAKLSANARYWSGADARRVRDELFVPAQQALEARIVLLQDPTFPTHPVGLFRQLVWPSTPLGVRLTGSEEMELARKLTSASLFEKTEKPPPSATDHATADDKSDTQPNGKNGAQAEEKISAQLIDGLKQLEFILLLAAFGALGASAQGLSSIANYLGRRRLDAIWSAYYVIRPWMGAVLGPVFYLVLRAGLMTSQTSWSDINHVGYAAIAVLVGFCSAEAMENLRDVASAFFRDKSGDNPMESVAPHISKVTVDPQADSVNSGATGSSHSRLVRVTGTGFRDDSILLLNGRPVIPELVDRDSRSMLLVVPLSADLIPPDLRVQVLNPGETPLLSNVLQVSFT